MDGFLSLVKKYLPLAEFIQYLVIVFGIVLTTISLRIGFKQLKINSEELRINTEAQQDLHAPRLIVSCREGWDKIAGTQIRNVGNLLAKNIRIGVKCIANPPVDDFSCMIPAIDVNESANLNFPNIYDTNCIQTIHIILAYDSPLNDRTRYNETEVHRNG